MFAGGIAGVDSMLTKWPHLNLYADLFWLLSDAERELQSLLCQPLILVLQLRYPTLKLFDEDISLGKMLLKFNVLPTESLNNGALLSNFGQQSLVVDLLV